MKKTVSILMAVFTLLSATVYADNALYIYRNDGNFNAFLDSRVDSIAYSIVDTAGVEHSSVVTQLVYTPDSVYRIPLSSIDSIAFTERPAPELKSDVFNLTAEHLPYIVSVENLTLTFNGSVPEDLLPQKGNVLVSEVYEGLLENGFAGRVKTITKPDNTVVIECEEVSITDIYERLIITGSSTSSTETSQPQYVSTKVMDSGSKEFELNGFSYSFGNVTVKDNPEARLDYTVFIEQGQSPIVSMFLHHTHNLTASISYSQDGDTIPEPFWLVKARANLPYGLYASVNLGAFWQAAGSMDLELGVPYTIGFVNGFSYNESGLTQVNRISKSKLGNPTATADINGSLTAGLAGRLTFGFVADKVLSVNGEVRGGVQLAASYKLSDYDVTTLGQDGTVYNLFKDTKINLNSYVAVNMGYGIVGFTGNVTCTGLKLPYEKVTMLKEWYLLPSFSTPVVKINEENPTAVITTKASRDLLMPVKVGVGLQKKDTKEQIGIQKSNVDYRIQSEYPLSEIGGIYTDLESEEIYTAYPVVEILGKDIHATPEVEFEIEDEIEDEITPGQEVDLGLSVKWAGWNVGASSPEQYGGYYAWGETEEKSDYDWDTYKYWSDEDDDHYWDSNEYINIGSNISSTQYDVATVKWGNGWRMPTKEELKELYNKCTFEGYTYKGVAGCKVTGPNGNSIFLPCAGGRYGTSLEFAGCNGYYWSGSLLENFSNLAWFLAVDDDGYRFVTYDGGRMYGNSVRPVR